MKKKNLPAGIITEPFNPIGHIYKARYGPGYHYIITKVDRSNSYYYMMALGKEAHDTENTITYITEYYRLVS